MKFICEHPTCDKEVIYKHKFEDHTLARDNWYEGDYCEEHMIEHLEHCINLIKKETP